MSDFSYNKALGYEFDNQFTKLIKYARLIYNNPNVSLGKEHLKKFEKFVLPYEETKTTHFENANKYYMEVFFNFINENKSFFLQDVSFSTRKTWLNNEDVQIVIKGEKTSKTLNISSLYRTAIHISDISKSSNNTDETLLYPQIVLYHFFRILKLVSKNDWTEEKEVMSNDIKSLSVDLGMEKPQSATASKSPLNFADIFNPKNMGMIEGAIKAITSNEKFSSLIGNLEAGRSNDGSVEGGNLNTSDLTSGVMEIMNAMKTEIPNILSTFNSGASSSKSE